jgi:hypothetical protein
MPQWHVLHPEAHLDENDRSKHSAMGQRDLHEHANHGMRPEVTEDSRFPLGNLPGTRYPDVRD